MNYGWVLFILPMFQYMACGKHFLIKTQDSQSVENNARKQLSHELSAEGAEKPMEVLVTMSLCFNLKSVIEEYLKMILASCDKLHISELGLAQ